MSVDEHVHVVLMAGGSGERFWPLSRGTRPKQLLPIVGDRPMVASVTARLAPWIPAERTWVIANARHIAALRKILPDLPADQIVGEPVGRDTAPCVACAAALLHARDPNAVMALMPADHVIGDAAAFLRNLRDAAAVAASRDALVTIGIPPTFPSTSYGYIEVGAPLERIDASHEVTTRFFRARRFLEKPDLARAEAFVADGRHRWNSGMFFWRTEIILNEIQTRAPKVYRVAERILDAARNDADLDTAIGDAYAEAPKISIDYAVMEHADNVLMADAEFDWDDVGSWPAVARHQEADADGNVMRGLARGIDISGCILIGDEGGLATAIGCRDLIIVHTPDATLVCPRNQAERLKELVRLLREDGGTEGFL